MPGPITGGINVTLFYWQCPRNTGAMKREDSDVFIHNQWRAGQRFYQRLWFLMAELSYKLLLFVNFSHS